jgi:redox-sensitive bicupin YhaK (pirin superfamily)/2-hydroxychromene-2-carboxylate isomerase
VIDGRDHALGPATAQVTLVEYGDYECPYTRRAQTVVASLRRRCGDRLRVVYRHFPLSQVHPHAEHAAEAAEAAGAQGRFWEMSDLLFQNQRDLGDFHLQRYATELGLDLARFNRELTEHTHVGRIHEDVQSGLRAGVQGTPTFFINSIRHDGPTDLLTLEAGVDQAMVEAEAAASRALAEEAGAPVVAATARSEQRVASLLVRPATEIYAADGGWFRTRWHFSFDEYYDPAHMGIGTLRVFNDDILVPGAVWPMHPHRNVEGITYVVSGHFEHADSLGHDGVLEPGGVQRMRLGWGAEHSERNHSQTEEMRFIQMWILPDRRNLRPAVEQRRYTTADRHNRLLQILRPEGAPGEGVEVAQDARMFVARLDADAAVEHTIADGHGGYFYVIEGALGLNDTELRTGDAAYVTGDGLLQIRATSPSELLLVETIL